MDRIAHFSALVAQQPGNPLFRFSLAQALDADNRRAEAADHYRICCASRADWMMPRILLGKLLVRAGDPAGAKPVLEEALRLAVDQHHEEPEKELRGLLEGL
jgi:predicted Zn-dependent protease